MELEKIHLYIAVFAGVVMTVVNIIIKASLVQVCTRLIVTLLVFYIAGLVTQGYMRRKIFAKPEPAEDGVSDEDSDEADPVMTDDGFLEQ